MRKAATMAAVVAATVLLSGCSMLGLDDCTSELGWKVTPTEVYLAPGESVTAEASAFGCGGRETLEVEMRWSSEDPSVAAVHETTGRITAEAPGSTVITGEDRGRYGIGPVAIPVTVEP